jgi:hydroxymethyl cephem carbamoyltransferase
MLVLGVNPDHDGAVAVVRDREVVFCAESEKDSFLRHEPLTPMTTFDLAERIGEIPDIVAIGGHIKMGWQLRGGNPHIQAGYHGQGLTLRDGSLFGTPVKFFSSSHVRSHIMGAAGMAPKDDAPLRAVLVWEGSEGSFFLLDHHWRILKTVPVLTWPGQRYSFLFAIADPRFADFIQGGDGDDAGKLMALAAYSHPGEADADVSAAIDRLLDPKASPTKGDYADLPFYNVGVEADVTKTAAALLHHRLFEVFARAAQQELPSGIPLYISGGCGLNCDWNTMWRDLGHFSSVFVPPCANDSGSSLGTALDALHAVTGDPRVKWDVYCGLEFEWDCVPDSAKWEGRPLEMAALADTIAAGRVVAWVQGRWELGPRALGNRSLLAEPFKASTRDRLNHIKQREGYRPIAPCCRIEDVGKVYDRDFHDPHMLYFRMVTTPDLKAVTHVDGSARVQTVTKESNRPQHELLSAFADRHGVGVLCNTSLNYKRLGFINRMADLADYCESRGVPDMVVGDAWFRRVEAPITLDDGALADFLVRNAIHQNVPKDASVLVVSEGVDELLELNERTGWHFPQNEDGTFQGWRPADSRDAITMLEALRERGASHLAIPAANAWWLDFYDGFKRHLETHHRLALQDSRCLIFALQQATAGPKARAEPDV